MELKPGYKQTEVGVIPDDWDCREVRDLIDLLTGFPFPSRGYSQSGIRLLRGSNVKRGNVEWSDGVTVYWPGVTADIQRYALKVGDIIVAMDGALVGRSFASLSAADVPALLLQRVARIRSDRVSQTYLRVWVCSRRFTRHCDAVKTTTAIPHISPADIRSFQIAIPPTKAEQDAIAEVVSDADALIASVERLIVKKRDVKQAAMQELLSGKTRLPGFGGAWDMKRLREVADTDPENLDGGTSPTFSFNYIALDDVDVGRLRSYSQQVFRTAPSRARRRVRQGDVLVSTVRPSLMSHLLFLGKGNDWVCSTGFCVVRCRNGIAYPAYVYFHMFTAGIARQIEVRLTGSNYPAINRGDVRTLQIPFPDYEEQRAISAVLSDMEAEIAALEAQLAKARQIKQGMMQELLTGRIRLV